MISMKRAALPVLGLAVAFGLFTWQAKAPVKAQGEAGKIVTVGHAELTAAPDTATVTVGVSVLKETANEAQTAAAADMAAVQQMLKNLGIPDKNVQTRNFRVGPEYEYDNGKQQLLGYRATHDLSIRVEQVDEIGKVLDVLVKAGATQVRDIQFSLRDNQQLLRQALEQAVQDANAKANALAAGAGVKVVRIVRMQDNTSVAAPVRADMMLYKASMAGAPENTQIAAGEITVRADVEVEFEFQ